jgi:hypothetical protein
MRNTRASLMTRVFEASPPTSLLTTMGLLLHEHRTGHPSV